jgi:adenosylcobinamide amidohydrolase
MLIGQYYNGVEIHRGNKMLYAKFLTPHRTISTCRVNGGFSEDLGTLLNHQSCEPNMHYRKMLNLAISDPADYLKAICQKEDLPSDKSACLSTATNMHYGVAEATAYRDVEVIAVTTAGAESNAARAGDPASYYEIDGHFENVDENKNALEGTINTMVFISKELRPGAMVSAVMVATEAKAAALQELAVISRYSNGLATGTGTDQIGIACNLGGGVPLSSADKHSKVGELIGCTVKQTVKKSLELHNEYTPLARGRVTVHIERLGCDVDELVAAVSGLLSGNQAEILKNNFEGVNRDPVVVASVAAIIHLWDKFTWGNLPASCLADIMCSYGAQIAAAVSGSYERIDHYRNLLSHENIGIGNAVFFKFIAKAIALGFGEKWRE